MPTLMEVIQKTAHLKLREIAESLDLAESTFYHKVNPVKSDDRQHRLYFTEFMQVLRITGKLQALDMIEHEFGRVAVKVDPIQGLDEDSWRKMLARTMKESGEFIAAFGGALADDGVVDLEEAAGIEAEAWEAAAASDRSISIG